MSDAYTEKQLARQAAENRTAARVEKLVCALMIVTASVVIGETVFTWCSDDQGFSSVPILAWPAAIVTAAIAVMVGGAATMAARIARRWIAAGAILAFVTALKLFGGVDRARPPSLTPSAAIDNTGVRRNPTSDDDNAFNTRATGVAKGNQRA